MFSGSGRSQLCGFEFIGFNRLTPPTSDKIRAKRGCRSPVAAYSYQILSSYENLSGGVRLDACIQRFADDCANQVDLKTQSKSIDFSGSTSTKPLKAGISLPPTCSVGEWFFLTSGSPGFNIHLLGDQRVDGARDGQRIRADRSRGGAEQRIHVLADRRNCREIAVALERHVHRLAACVFRFCERGGELAGLRLDGEQVAHLGRPGRHTAGASRKRRRSDPRRSAARDTALGSSRALHE